MTCGMPGWNQLLRALIKRGEAAVTDDAKRALVRSAREALSNNNLLLSASLIRQCLSASELDLAVRQQFDLSVFKNCSPDLMKRMTQRMRDLVTTPWAGIITTNYDELIEHALAKWADGETYQSLGSDNRLGVILANGQGAQFFVKLHGTIGGSQIVLSTEEYDRMYLGAPQVSAFLTAVMLNYHLVFLGCSLEDELVRLRKRLNVDFGGVIPMSYAFLPKSRDNVLRSGSLRDNAQIESLLYPENDTSHRSIDWVLHKLSTLVIPSKSLRLSMSRTAAEVLRERPERRLKSIGNLNRALLKWIFDNPGHLISKDTILNPRAATSKAPPHLARQTPEERMYRVFFLVSLKLVEERVSRKAVVYTIPARICDALLYVRGSD